MSLIHSSDSSSLLFIPSHVFFVSVIEFFTFDSFLGFLFMEGLTEALHSSHMSSEYFNILHEAYFLSVFCIAVLL